jgi:YVTN family beta-propeller protein
MYVTNRGSDSVSVIDTNSNLVIGSPIPVESMPIGIEFDRPHKRMYVTNGDSDSVSVIDTNTNTAVGLPLVVGANPQIIAFAPP